MSISALRRISGVAVGFDQERHLWLHGVLAPQRRTVIVDVGANPAEPVVYSDMLAAGTLDLVGFEPGPQAFATLQQTKGPHETYFANAVGDGRTRDLLLRAHSTMTSFFENHPPAWTFLGRFRPAMQVTQRARLNTKALDQIAELPEYDLLKIDIQGGEAIVFDGARRTLAAAVAVITELRYYQLYKDEPMLGGLDTMLRGLGFALHKLLPIKALMLPTSQKARLKPGAHRNQMIDGDGVYLRDLGLPDALTPEQLKHLALLADGLFFSHDLVVRCLDLLVARDAIAADLPTAYVDRLPSAMRTDKG